MKLSDSSLPACGKLNETGTITSGPAATMIGGLRRQCDATRPRRASRSLQPSISPGSTMNRSPATKATINESRRRPNRSRMRTSVKAAMSPGMIHSATIIDMAT